MLPMADDAEQTPKASPRFAQQLENETGPERMIALTSQFIDALDAEENCG